MSSSKSASQTKNGSREGTQRCSQCQGRSSARQKRRMWRAPCAHSLRVAMRRSRGRWVSLRASAMISSMTLRRSNARYTSSHRRRFHPRRLRHLAPLRLRPRTHNHRGPRSQRVCSPPVGLHALRVRRLHSVPSSLLPARVALFRPMLVHSPLCSINCAFRCLNCTTTTTTERQVRRPRCGRAPGRGRRRGCTCWGLGCAGVLLPLEIGIRRD